MNPALAIRIIDLAFVALSAWQNHQDQQAEDDETLREIRKLRERVLLGEVPPADLVNRIDGMIAGIVAKRKDARSRVPLPVGRSNA